MHVWTFIGIQMLADSIRSALDQQVGLQRWPEQSAYLGRRWIVCQRPSVLVADGETILISDWRDLITAGGKCFNPVEFGWRRIELGDLCSLSLVLWYTTHGKSLINLIVIIGLLTSLAMTPKFGAEFHVEQSATTDLHHTVRVVFREQDREGALCGAFLIVSPV